MESNFIFEKTDESTLVEHYFKKSFPYETILHLLQVHHGIFMSLRSVKRCLRVLGLQKKKPVSVATKACVRQVILDEVRGPASLKDYKDMWNKLKTTYGIQIKRDEIHSLFTPNLGKGNVDF